MEDFPSAHNTGSTPRSQRVDGETTKNSAAEFRGPHHLHVDVQRHRLDQKRQPASMRRQIHRALRIMPDISPQDIRWSFLGPEMQKSGMQLSLTGRREPGIVLQGKEWFRSQRRERAPGLQRNETSVQRSAEKQGRRKHDDTLQQSYCYVHFRRQSALLFRISRGLVSSFFSATRRSSFTKHGETCWQTCLFVTPTPLETWCKNAMKSSNIF